MECALKYPYPKDIMAADTLLAQEQAHRQYRICQNSICHLKFKSRKKCHRKQRTGLNTMRGTWYLTVCLLAGCPAAVGCFTVYETYHVRQLKCPVSIRISSGSLYRYSEGIVKRIIEPKYSQQEARHAVHGMSSGIRGWVNDMVNNPTHRLSGFEQRSLSSFTRDLIAYFTRMYVVFRVLQAGHQYLERTLER